MQTTWIGHHNSQQASDSVSQLLQSNSLEVYISTSTRQSNESNASDMRHLYTEIAHLRNAVDILTVIINSVQDTT